MRGIRVLFAPFGLPDATCICNAGRTEVWHRDIRNVQLTQTFFQRILSTGRIGIGSSASSGMEIDVAGLRDPDEIKTLIDRHRAKADKASKD
jgi:hypothetical protein